MPLTSGPRPWPADRAGAPEAARQLSLESGLIYNCRKALRLTQTSTEAEQEWLYLATVIDLFSRLVVGWAMRAIA